MSRCQFENQNDIGVFCKLTNAYCLVAIGGSENFYSVFQVSVRPFAVCLSFFPLFVRLKTFEFIVVFFGAFAERASRPHSCYPLFHRWLPHYRTPNMRCKPLSTPISSPTIVTSSQLLSKKGIRMGCWFPTLQQTKNCSSFATPCPTVCPTHLPTFYPPVFAVWREETVVPAPLTKMLIIWGPDCA